MGSLRDGLMSAYSMAWCLTLTKAVLFAEVLRVPPQLKLLELVPGFEDPDAVSSSPKRAAAFHSGFSGGDRRRAQVIWILRAPNLV